MSAVFFYLGRALQVSGLALGLLIILMFFNRANGESLLLIMTCVSVAVFTTGHLLTRATGTE